MKLIRNTFYRTFLKKIKIPNTFVRRCKYLGRETKYRNENEWVCDL